jgi:hypothetical protein
VEQPFDVKRRLLSLWSSVKEPFHNVKRRLLQLYGDYDDDDDDDDGFAEDEDLDYR